MKTRALTELDYPMLCEWGRWFRFDIPQQKFLPNNGLGGIMITKDGIDICAGFLFFTNSKIAWLEFVVSNPKYRETDRNQAIEFLINQLVYIAKDKGFEAIFTSVKHPNLIKKFENIGFVTGSNNTKEMIFLHQ